MKLKIILPLIIFVWSCQQKETPRKPIAKPNIPAPAKRGAIISKDKKKYFFIGELLPYDFHVTCRNVEINHKQFQGSFEKI